MPLWSCSNCVCAGWYCRVEPVSFPARKSGFRREKYLLQKMQQGSCAFGLAKSKNPFVPFNECRGRPGSGLSGRKVTARPAKHEPARSGVCWERRWLAVQGSDAFITLLLVGAAQFNPEQHFPRYPSTHEFSCSGSSWGYFGKRGCGCLQLAPTRPV